MIIKKNTLYRARQKQGVPPIENMIALAREFSEEREYLSICLGMASSPSHQEIAQNLCHIGLEKAFDFVFSGDDDLLHYKEPEGTNKP